MPNEVYKSDEFEASTRVMESGLLRVLTDESSGKEADEGADASSGASPHIDIVVAEPVVEQLVVPPAVEQLVVPPAVEQLVVPPVVEPSVVPPKAAPEPPRRGSRLFVVAGVVAALVLAFDTSLFLSHQRRVAPTIAAPSAPDPMPRYMVLPLSAPPAPIEEAQAEDPPAAAPPTAVVAAAPPASSEAAVRSHPRSQHRHGRH